MEKESLEVIDESEYNVVYDTPKLHRRVLGNLIDILIFALIGVALFIASHAIVTNTPGYVSAFDTVCTYREESGLYKYQSDRNTWELITTYYDNDATDVDYPLRIVGCKKAINDFHAYVQKCENEGKVEVGTYVEVTSDYNKVRLETKYNGKNLFILDTDGVTVIENNVDRFSSEVYYKNFYKNYIMDKCGGFLSARFPAYLSSMQTMSNCLFFIEIPSAYLLAAILVYYVPGLFFKRNRCTLGKALYRIGLVNNECVSVPFWRYTARSAIFIFGELVLSLFTFGIPFIISFTMMLVTKRKQGFPDYMLKCTEIDTSKSKIYFNQYEANLEVMNNHKDAVKFKPEYRD